MTTVEVLRAARARIDTPEKWWKPGHEFRGECALVALRGTANGAGLGWRERVGIGSVLARAMDFEHGFQIPEFNNSHTHEEVLAAFDTAIAHELARQQEFTVAPVMVEEPVVA